MKRIDGQRRVSFWSRLQNGCIFVVQIAAYIVYVLPCRFVYRIERNFSGTIEKMQRGSLIIANHVSTADPFVILAHIPLLAFIRMTPIYFPIDPDYFRRPVLHFWLVMFGGYDAGKTPKEKFLMILRTRMLLRRGETVFLFPEGKINATAIGKFERGIEYFASEANGVALIKTGGLLLHPKNFLADRRSITFLGVKTFLKNDAIFAQELREMFLRC